MTDNLKIWDALSKTDPSHTKEFRRSGGFSGTSVKPIWMQLQMTSHFGPSGVGWGVNKPEFQIVECGEERLVYCTLSIWHGDKDNIVWGVGGDKAVGKNKYGLFADDEAFKKAFTDAQSNAMKALGVAADIHMGLFDDDKYVQQMRREFSEQNQLPDNVTDLIAQVKDASTTEALSELWEKQGAAFEGGEHQAIIRNAFNTHPLKKKAS